MNVYRSVFVQYYCVSQCRSTRRGCYLCLIFTCVQDDLTNSSEESEVVTWLFPSLSYLSKQGVVAGRGIIHIWTDKSVRNENHSCNITLIQKWTAQSIIPCQSSSSPCSECSIVDSIAPRPGEYGGGGSSCSPPTVDWWKSTEGLSVNTSSESSSTSNCGLWKLGWWGPVPGLGIDSLL